MGVERHKVSQLPVDDPFDDALAVLALDLEPFASSPLLLPVTQGLVGTGQLQFLVVPLVACPDAVTNAEPDVAEKNRHSATSLLVPVDPRLHDHDGEGVGEELICHVRGVGALVELLPRCVSLLPAEPQRVPHLLAARGR